MTITIGIGIKPKTTAIVNPPTNLLLTLISGGVQIDWTDNSGGLAQTEIWARSDSGTSALLITIAAGTSTHNDILNAVDLRYYKIRSLKSGVYSDFTAESSIAMLGAEIIINGTFADATGWTLDAQWAIGGGKASFTAGIGNGGIRRNAVVTATKTYRIKFDILDWVAQIGAYGFLTQALLDAFGAPFNNYQDFNGSYTYYRLCLNSSTQLYVMYGDGGYNNFSLDNVSVKEVLFP